MAVVLMSWAVMRIGGGADCTLKERSRRNRALRLQNRSFRF
jgi:hypothetical protein